MKPKNTLSIFMFGRAENVLPRDFEAFLMAFSPSHLGALQLRELFDAVVISVNGYDDDPRELPEIPEVREFFQSLHAKWPYFPFFLNVASESVLLFTLCLTPEIRITRRAEASKFQSTTTMDGVRLIRDSFAATHDVFKRAGMSDLDERRRVDEVFRALFPGAKSSEDIG